MARMSRWQALAALVTALQLSTSMASGGNGSAAITIGGNPADSDNSGSDTSTIATPTRRDLLTLDARSGLRAWVDPTTPADKQVYTSSRGDKWDLVMSDEFGLTNRSFKPGEDHLWTTLEKPDGVNGALELYSHDMASVVCDQSDEDGTKRVCYLQIKTIDEVNTISIYNQYTRPPAYQNSTFYYRAAMLQSWNKFCFQGGMLEIRAKLPGATSKASGNPDIAKGPNGRVEANEYYPTWPGLWVMGNLGRAIFSASTQRMWPFSYNQCDERVFASYNQRISACNGNPGHGLNPYQGRGAPEIDILEGGGVGISSSIQIGPGMAQKFRRIPVNKTIDASNLNCFYGAQCKTTGANLPNVPTKPYADRKIRSWYTGLRYAGNDFCEVNRNLTQAYEKVAASLKTGITENKCTFDTCPGSFDVQADLGYIDGNKTLGRWGINANGNCFTDLNAYQGVFLCDPDNQNPNCEAPRNDTTAPTNTMAKFDYQMDALSANWAIHVAAYTSFLLYQLEWVTGDEGYIRWMLHGNPIFEIPAESVINTGQDETNSNPVRTFLEEPMYIIFNVAISQQWATHPPNTGKPCRGDGKDPKANRICDSFPMYMNIDYIRLYQDLSSGSNMALGCDPASHPTRQWIQDHIEEYTDDVNMHIDVNGGARCRTSQDCTIPWSSILQFQTGHCNAHSVCECSNQYWGGPRCTHQLHDTSSNGQVAMSTYGPPLYAAIMVAGVALTVTLIVIVIFARKRRAQRAAQLVREEKNRVRVDPGGEVLSAKAHLMPVDYEEVESTKNNGYYPNPY